MNRLIVLTISTLLLVGCHAERKIMDVDIEQKNLLFMEKSSSLSEFFKIEDRNLKSITIYDSHRESVIVLDPDFNYIKSGRKTVIDSEEKKKKVIHNLNLIRASNRNTLENLSFGYLIEIEYEDKSLVSLVIANSVSENDQYVPIKIMKNGSDKVINIKKDDLNRLFSEFNIYPVL